MTALIKKSDFQHVEVKLYLRTDWCFNERMAHAEIAIYCRSPKDPDYVLWSMSLTAQSNFVDKYREPIKQEDRHPLLRDTPGNGYYAVCVKGLEIRLGDPEKVSGINVKRGLEMRGWIKKTIEKHAIRDEFPECELSQVLRALEKLGAQVSLVRKDP